MTQSSLDKIISDPVEAALLARTPFVTGDVITL